MSVFAFKYWQPDIQSSLQELKMKKVRVSLEACGSHRDYDFYWLAGRAVEGEDEYEELIELLDEMDQGECAFGSLAICVEATLTQAECLYDEIGGPVFRNINLPISSTDDATLHIKMEEV